MHKAERTQYCLPYSYAVQKTERHVFLLDGLAVCCKPRQGGHELYRLKEKINLRHVKLIDQPDDNELTGQASTVVHAHSVATTYVHVYRWYARQIFLLTRSKQCCPVITGSSRSGPTMNFSRVYFHACCMYICVRVLVHVYVC